MIFFLPFILSLCTTIRPKIRFFINLFCLFLHDHRPKLGVTLTLKSILFLIVPIFCLQYCLCISSATIIPLYFAHYIHRSAAFIFRTLYPWLYEVLTVHHRLRKVCFHSVFPILSSLHQIYFRRLFEEQARKSR